MEIVEIIDLNRNVKQQLKKHRCSYKKHFYSYMTRLRTERAVVDIQNMKNEMDAQFSTAYVITQRKKGGKRARILLEVGL